MDFRGYEIKPTSSNNIRIGCSASCLNAAFICLPFRKFNGNSLTLKCYLSLIVKIFFHDIHSWNTLYMHLWYIHGLYIGKISVPEVFFLLSIKATCVMVSMNENEARAHEQKVFVFVVCCDLLLRTH